MKISRTFSTTYDNILQQITYFIHNVLYIIQQYVIDNYASRENKNCTKMHSLLIRYIKYHFVIRYSNSEQILNTYVREYDRGNF